MKQKRMEKRRRQLSHRWDEEEEECGDGRQSNRLHATMTYR